MKEIKTMRKKIKDPESLSEAIGKAILIERIKAGLSQVELSKLTGIDKSTISLIERGCQDAKVVTLDKFCSVFKIKISAIIRQAEKLLAQKSKEK